MAPFHYRKIYKLGKIQFIGGPKGFKLCRRDEYGLANLRKKCMVKGTHLYREFILRLEARKITVDYILLKKKGMLTWPAYQEHRESIQKSFAVLHLALARYKDRRIKAGFFYMLAHPLKHSVFVMSPLYTMPRQQALKKIRQLHRNREAFEQRSSDNSIPSKSMVAPQLLLFYIFVIALACMIVYL